MFKDHEAGLVQLGPGIDEVSAEVLIEELNPNGNKRHKEALLELKRRAKSFDAADGFYHELLELHHERRLLLKKIMS